MILLHINLTLLFGILPLKLLPLLKVFLFDGSFHFLIALIPLQLLLHLNVKELFFKVKPSLEVTKFRIYSCNLGLQPCLGVVHLLFAVLLLQVHSLLGELGEY